MTDPVWVDPTPPEAMAGAVADAHRSAFGGEPDGVWAAPGRTTLVGEHVDYNDGLTLLIALPYRTVVAARRRTDDQVRVRSVQASSAWSGRVAGLAPGSVAGWSAYAVGAVWALLEAGCDVPGLDLMIDSTVPLGSGLSSSAALVCAVAAAAAELGGQAALLADAAGRARLAEIAVTAETVFVGAPTGGMDQAASVRSAAGHALLLDCRTNAVEHVPFDLAASDLRLVVIDTRSTHSHVDGAYMERRRSCEQAATALGLPALRDAPLVTDLDRLDPLLARRARHVITEIDRVRDAAHVLRSGRVDQLGPLLSASHASLRDDFEVSGPELDLAVDAALAGGALGARMTGGGFGGSAIALVARSDVGRVAGSVTEAFLGAGRRPPRLLDGRPAEPASRLR